MRCTAALCAVALAVVPVSVPVPPPELRAADAAVVSVVAPGPVPAVLPWVGSAAASPGAVTRAGSPAPHARFRWPLDGTPRPARRFEPPPQPWLPGHRGVDLVAAPDAVVRAAGPGVVLFAGPVAGRRVVTVGHTAGLRTTYEPVWPGVRAGDRVAAGAVLGRLRAGHAGCPEPACLHWGLRRGEQYLDPLALLGIGPVRLLPT
ncbi:M23 family metallopeptidase [Micromonospora sp. RTGN7]|uniref:murein hydrolase activator EnvC family protein n=1 Tax=Micromonospora sp. RTGN7 TaxID=3016526 RepID=UPI0029FF0C30|nr:M23 family metallopeptidase [Micromonospora sp. RTGN7]